MADGEWHTVDTKAKQQAKQLMKAQKRAKENNDSESQRRLEDEKRFAAKRAYEAQYANLTGVNHLSQNSYSYLSGQDPDGSTTKKAVGKKKKSLANEEFHGEELQFQQPKADVKKSKGGKRSKKPQQQQQQNKASSSSLKSLEDAVSEFDEDALVESLESATETYPNNYEVQLKSVAEFFEVAFDNVEDENLQPGGPLTYFSEGIVGHLSDWMSEIPPAELTKFLIFLIEYLVRSHGSSKEPRPHVGGLGIKALAQFMMTEHPDDVLNAIPQITAKYVEKATSTFPVQHAHFFLWLFSQALPRQPTVALTLWLKFFLPAVLKNNTPQDLRNEYLDFLQDILEASDQFDVSEEIAASSFEQILLAKYSNPKYPSDLDSLLQLSILFSGKNAHLASVFRSLLSHADSETEGLQEHVNTLLSDCLKYDESLFQVWRDLYADNIGGSNNLMIHLLRTFKDRGGVSGNHISRIARDFLEQNERMKKGVSDPKTKKHRKLTADIRELIATSDQTFEQVHSRLKSHEVAEKKPRKSGNDGEGSSALLVLGVVGVVGALGAFLGLSMFCCDTDACLHSPVGDLFC